MINTTCIMCPLGCQLTIEEKDDEIIVSGNTCIRGETYGKTEIKNPVRTLSSLVRVGDRVVPVKTTGTIPKAKIDDVLHEISKIKLASMPEFGTIIIKNVLDLGVDVISIGY